MSHENIGSKSSLEKILTMLDEVEGEELLGKDAIQKQVKNMKEKIPRVLRTKRKPRALDREKKSSK